jgi:dimethylamine monooxygenase subunit C
LTNLFPDKNIVFGRFARGRFWTPQTRSGAILTGPAIKSQPTYARLSIDASAQRHLLVTDRAEVPLDSFAEGTLASAFNEVWRVLADSRAIPAFDTGGASHVFRSETHLLIALRRRLLEEHMGLRLYAAGTEPFLWRVHGLGEDFGLGREEMQLYASGSGARRVFCNHCRTITEKISTNIFDCSGCGAKLFVRDHFSRRINAYAGVQVDAEVPGEFPELEVLYR